MQPCHHRVDSVGNGEGVDNDFFTMTKNQKVLKEITFNYAHNRPKHILVIRFQEPFLFL